MKALRIAVLASLISLSACSTTSGPSFTFVGERLIAAIPDGWQNTLTLESKTSRFADFIPPDQTAQDWKTQLSFEALSTEGFDSDPLEVLAAQAVEDQGRCEFTHDYNVYSGYENNFETSVRLFLCTENAFSKQGEIKLIKIIRGNKFMHTIRLVQRVPPFKFGEEDFSPELMASWSQFMNSILLCDDTDIHPCPAPSEDDS